MDANELARLREDLAETLPDTCDILSVSRAADGFGGMVETWTTASAAIPCRMDAKTGKEVIQGGAVETYQGNMLTLPYSANITTANRVSYGGNTYNVLAVNEGSWLGVKRVTVTRI